MSDWCGCRRLIASHDLVARLRTRLMVEAAMKEHGPEILKQKIENPL